MQHLLIGTAGHVDHGKTTLIGALTGIDTDRLQEEKERGLSIELGFAYLDLPGGARAGIVDVPGHERFLKNMLTGAYAMDVVLLVVDASEGVMPQTVEHLQIINLLGARAGIIVITKVDLADEEMLELVMEEAVEAVEGTVLEGAPVVQVSAVTGAGLDELKAAIVHVIEEATQVEKPPGIPRLYADRVFPVAGFGAVVTGTLMGGEIRLEDRVLLQPRGLEARVRSIQNHGQAVDAGHSGQRLALNLAGLQLEEVERGNVVCPLELQETTTQVDVRLQLLESLPDLFQHWTRVRLYTGTREVFGRIALMGADEALPGATCYAQIRLESPVLALRGDRFIVRDFPARRTLGGGVVLDPFPPRHRRHAEATMERFRRWDAGDDQDALLHLLESGIALSVPEERLAYYLPRHQEERTALVEHLEQEGRLLRGRAGGVNRLISSRRAEDWQQQVMEQLGAFHAANPLSTGMNLAAIQQAGHREVDPATFEWLVQRGIEKGVWTKSGNLLRLAQHRLQFSEQEEGLRRRLEQVFRQAGFAPPSAEEAVQQAGGDAAAARRVLRAMLQIGELEDIGQGFIFHPQVVEQARQRLHAQVGPGATFTVSDFRQWVGTSRKYAVPLLEYFDQAGFTRRRGNDRVLRET